MTYPVKPPFSYYGGKQRLAARICNLLPPHTVYVEPFCGSAAVYFKKGLPQNNSATDYREVLNDLNGIVVNFFRVMQEPEQMAELIHRLEWTVYSQDEHRKAKALCKEPIENPVLMAWAWFCNVNWSFANKAGSGFGTGVYSRESATTHYNAVERLKEYRDRLKCTTVMQEPALRVIERFDSPHTCFYVDPPYPNTEQGHYKGFTQADFEQLIDKLKQCHGAVLLSCYANDYVPSDWQRFEFETVASSAPLTHTSGKRGISAPTDRQKDKRIECVWYKPASTPMREKLVPIAKRNYEQLKFNFEELLCNA